MQADAFVSTERHSGTLGGVDPTGAAAEDGQAQLVVGSAGKDTLTGGSLNDTLVAASGQTTMTGGAGADLFDFGKGGTNATITDFQVGVGKLQFENAGKYDLRNAQVRQDHGSVVVTVGDGHVVLQGVNLHQLHPHDL